MGIRTAAVLVLALTLGAVQPAEGRARPRRKPQQRSIRVPVAGQASVLQFKVRVTIGRRTPQPRIKGRLPADVGVLMGSRRTSRAKVFTETLVVIHRKPAARTAHAAQNVTGNTRRVTVTFVPGLVYTAWFEDDAILGRTLSPQDCKALPGAHAAFGHTAGRGVLGVDVVGPALRRLVGAGCGRVADANTLLCANNLAGCTPKGGGGGGGTTSRWPGFTAPDSYVTGGGTNLAAGDLNGDGQRDIVVSNDASFTVLIRGPTGFSPTTVPGPSGLVDVAVGDFNGDGNGDIAGDTATGVYFLLGNGTGTAFSPQPPLALGGAPLGRLLAFNANGDGITDLAVGELGTDVLAVLLGMTYKADAAINSGGQDPGPMSAWGVAPQNLFASFANGFSFLPANGDGTFQAPVTTATTLSALQAQTSFTSGDQNWVLAVDGGGHVDLLAFDAAGHEVGDPRLLDTGGSAVGIGAGDFNQDGLPDMVTLFNGTQAAGFLPGTTTSPFFGPSVKVPLDASVSGGNIVVGDFNGDGLSDFAAATDGKVELLYAQKLP